MTTTELINVIKVYESFVLGICRCGCKTEIPIRGKNRMLQTFKHNHHSKFTKRKTGSEHPNWKGGRILINDYWYIKKPDHHFATKAGYVRESHLVVEEYYRCCLLSWAVVHHINKNTQDNRIENLMVFFNQSEHTKYEHPLLDRSNCYCLLCYSNKTYIEKNNIPHWYNYKFGYICKNCYRKNKKK